MPDPVVPALASRAARIAGGLAALLLAAACSSLAPPVREPALDIPDAWPQAGIGTQAPAADWWRMFGDTALDQLVEEALAHNLDVAAATKPLLEALGCAVVHVASADAALEALAGGGPPYAVMGAPLPLVRVPLAESAKPQ